MKLYYQTYIVYTNPFDFHMNNNNNKHSDSVVWKNIIDFITATSNKFIGAHPDTLRDQRNIPFLGDMFHTSSEKTYINCLQLLNILEPYLNSIYLRTFKTFILRFLASLKFDHPSTEHFPPVPQLSTLTAFLTVHDLKLIPYITVTHKIYGYIIHMFTIFETSIYIYSICMFVHNGKAIITFNIYNKLEQTLKTNDHKDSYYITKKKGNKKVQTKVFTLGIPYRYFENICSSLYTPLTYAFLTFSCFSSPLPKLLFGFHSYFYNSRSSTANSFKIISNPIVSTKLTEYLLNREGKRTYFLDFHSINYHHPLLIELDPLPENLDPKTIDKMNYEVLKDFIIFFKDSNTPNRILMIDLDNFYENYFIFHMDRLKEELNLNIVVKRTLTGNNYVFQIQVRDSLTNVLYFKLAESNGIMTHPPHDIYQQLDSKGLINKYPFYKYVSLLPSLKKVDLDFINQNPALIKNLLKSYPSSIVDFPFVPSNSSYFTINSNKSNLNLTKSFLLKLHQLTLTKNNSLTLAFIHLLNNELITFIYFMYLAYLGELFLIQYDIDITKTPAPSLLSMKLFKTFYLSPKTIIDLKGPVLEELINSYFGSPTEFSQHSGKNIFIYDINSLYPFSMTQPMPIGVPIPFDKDQLNSPSFNIDHFFGFLLVRFKAPENLKYPLLLVRYAKKFSHSSFINSDYSPRYALGEGLGWYFSEEIKLALKLGYQIEYIKGYQFEKGYPFKNFVKDFYFLKSESNNELSREFYKLILNSLYGNFGRTRRNLVKPDTLLSPEIKKKFFKNSPYTPNDFGLESNVAIASAITSYSRIYFYDYKASDHVIYSDTDAIFTTQPLSKNKISNKLGKFKIEAQNARVLIFGPKQYLVFTPSNHTFKLTKLALKNIPSHLHPYIHLNVSGIKLILKDQSLNLSQLLNNNVPKDLSYLDTSVPETLPLKKPTKYLDLNKSYYQLVNDPNQRYSLFYKVREKVKSNRYLKFTRLNLSYISIKKKKKINNSPSSISTHIDLLNNYYKKRVFKKSKK